MAAHPIPSRERIIAAYDRGEGAVRELTRIFSVSKMTIQNYLDRQTASGTLEPSPRRNGPKSLIDAMA